MVEIKNYALIKDGKIENIIILEEGNYTSSFIENDRGDKMPTFQENGQTKISTTLYLLPQGYTAEIYPGRGSIGDNWPLPPLVE